MNTLSHDTHSTTQEGAWTTKRIAITALLCAVAALCTLFIEFPLLPHLEFLKYDPSGIVALIAGLAFGPATAVIVSILPNLVHIATQSGLYGMLMAVLATLTLSLPVAIIHQHKQTFTGALIGMVVGGICSLFFCVAGNLVITPLYMGVQLQDVLKLIVPAILPFNLVKILLHCVVAALLYKQTIKLLNN